MLLSHDHLVLLVLTPLTSAGPQDQHLVDEDTLEEDGSQDAELLGLTEDAVYTTMRFSRPFRSCDPHDLDITVLSGRGGKLWITRSFSSWRGWRVPAHPSPPSRVGPSCARLETHMLSAG